MKKKTLIISLILVAVIAAAIGIVSIFSGFKKYDFGISFTESVRVDETGAHPGSHTETLTVPKSGTYIFTADWVNGYMSIPGFVTGIIVKDASGRHIFATSGGLLESSGSKRKLEKGPITIEFSFLASRDDYAAYIRDNDFRWDPDGIDPAFYRTGEWTMKYSCDVELDKTPGFITALVLAVAIGVLLLILVTVAARDENGAVKKYDERQILMQGKGYRYAFFTAAAYFICLSMLLWTNVEMAVETSLLVLIGVLLSGLVAVTVFVFKDAYFRPDENNRVYVIFFVFLAVLNLVPGIGKVVQNQLMVGYTFTFNGCANLVCGIAVCYALVIFLIKSVIDRKEGE